MKKLDATKNSTNHPWYPTINLSCIVEGSALAMIPLYQILGYFQTEAFSFHLFRTLPLLLDMAVKGIVGLCKDQP
jgi:hypothetical protein